MASCLQRGPPDQQLAQDALVELLEAPREQEGLQRSLVLDLLHAGLEVLLQRGQSLPGLFQTLTAGSSRVLGRQHRDLRVLQELDRVFNGTGVASETLSSTEDLLLERQ